VHFLEREIEKLKRRVEASKADVQVEARNSLKARRQKLHENRSRKRGKPD